MSDARPLYVVAHNGSAILGGGETGTALLLRGLRERGHRVLMLCRDAEMALRVEAFAGIPVDVLRVGGAASLHDAPRLALRLRRERPDVALLTTFKKVLLAGLAARMAGVPRVVQRIVLEGDTPARGPGYRFAFRHLVDLVALNAEAMRAPFLAGDPGLDPARVVTLLDGVERPAATRPRGALRAELGIPADAPVVGAVARLARQKRLERLVAALVELPGVHAVIAGEGEEHEALEAQGASLGVAHRLHLLGFRRDVGDVLDALDLFVICSDREGMANAMLEGMMCGVPVLSTPVSGAAEALAPLEDGTPPGVILPAADTPLAPALAALLADRDRLAAMGRAARQQAETRFGAAAFLDRWEAALRPPPGRVR